jgi:replicative DNA helicase
MIDAEANVLGAILCDSTAYYRVSDLLTADDFAHGGHRRMWALIGDMLRAGDAVDVVTVAERDPSIERLVFEVSQSPGSIANTRAYGEVVAKRALERRIIAAGVRISALRGDDVLSEAHRILSAASPQSSSSVRHVREVLAESSRELVRRYESQAQVTGLATSLPGLDELTGGLQPGDLIILAARPSVGKTALAMQIALHVAGMGTPAFVVSAEMAGRQLTDRMLAHLSHVSLKAIRAPHLIEDEGWTGITRGSKQLQDLPMWIDDSTGITGEAIAARARQLDAQKRLGLIVVDYLGLLRMPKAERRDIAVGEVVKTLKALAKSLNVPVVLLAQLNRDAAGARPTLNTLRESGDIEQDADVVTFLHRPDEAHREQIELILAKQRNGEVGSLWLKADMPRMRFTETEAPRVEQPQARSGFRAGGFSSARDRAAGG